MEKKLNKDKTLKIFKKIMLDHIFIKNNGFLEKTDEIDMNDKINALYIDSLDIVEIVISIENTFGINIDDYEIEHNYNMNMTLNECFDHLWEFLQNQIIYTEEDVYEA